MRPEFTDAMRRATELVRAGNPAAATDLIQSSLGNSGRTTTASNSNSPFLKLSGTTAKRGRTTRSLRDTLNDLASNRPMAGNIGSAVSEPVIPSGASFDHGTFTCASGSREYRVYVPNLDQAHPAGMVMMLHGCTQSPVDFANGTGMNALAEQHNLIVVYPAQSRGANMQSCWNWFGPSDQERGGGEPAILVGLAMKLQREHDVPAGKVFVAGLSAGAAMAVILGRTYPEVFAGVGAHSGLPYKSAHDMQSAFAAMGGGLTNTSARASHTVPTIVFHGTADKTVSPQNGQRIADEAAAKGAQVLDDGTIKGRRFTRTTVLEGDARMEHWRVDGLGHAWSGGNPAGSYTDKNGPDASAEMVRFFLNIPMKG